MKRLVIAAFIFGMATGYCAALWQICAQKAHARQEMSIETGKDLSDGSDRSARK